MERFGSDGWMWVRQAAAGLFLEEKKRAKQPGWIKESDSLGRTSQVLRLNPG